MANNDKEARNEYMRAWRAKNRAIVNRQARERERERYRTDPVYREHRLRQSKLRQMRTYWADPEAARAKSAAAAKRWREANPEKVRQHKERARLRRQERRFGPLHDFDHDRCAICRHPFELGTRYLKCLDHDHATNKARGFLCRRCNSVLGMCDDEPRLLRKMAKYLIRHKEASCSS